MACASAVGRKIWLVSPTTFIEKLNIKCPGDIVYIEPLGSPIVILNTIEAVNALFDKRGTNYSHRPIFTMAGELMGPRQGGFLNRHSSYDRLTDCYQSMAVINYGKTWAEHGKLTHIAFSPEAVKQYYRAQEHITLLLLQGLLDTPQKFNSLLRL